MATTNIHTDYHLLDVDEIVAIHQYPTIVDGFSVWQTDFVDDYDEDGKFNRYRQYGPFAELVELLEQLNLWDNKIAIEYKNGLFVGFYDRWFSVGTKCTHLGHTYIKTHEEIMERYKNYCERCKNRGIKRKF